MARSATSVQLDPSQDSVSALKLEGGLVLPAKANALVCIPAPLRYSLPVFKSPTSVQLEPFHDSLLALFGIPPKANPDEELTPDPAQPAGHRRERARAGDPGSQRCREDDVAQRDHTPGVWWSAYGQHHAERP